MKLMTVRKVCVQPLVEGALHGPVVEKAFAITSPGLPPGVLSVVLVHCVEVDEIEGTVGGIVAPEQVGCFKVTMADAGVLKGCEKCQEGCGFA